MRTAPNQAVTVGFRVKNSSGALVNADSTPTATVYRNGVATALVATVTSGGSTGRYTAAWTNGAYSAGDQLQLEVTATVSGTTYTALVWEATVDAVAATHSAADAATAVRAELATELGRLDAAVSSRSSHTAATAATAVRTELATELERIDVATSSRLAATAAPANFADLAITATTGRVTVGTNNDKSGYSITGAITTLDALATHGDAQWSTATGFSTHSASDAAGAVRMELAAELANLDAAVSTRGTFSLAASETANLVHFFTVVTPSKTMNDVGTAAAGLTAADVWAYATRTLTESSTGGTGDTVVEVTVTDDSAVVVQSARVNIYAADGAPLGIFAYTNASGVATFQLNDGDYLAGIGSISGFNAHAPQAFTVSAAAIVSGRVSVALTIGRTTSVTPADPALCLVKCYITDAGGQAVEGITISATPKSRSLTVPSKIITLIAATAETDATGYAELLLPRADAIDSGGSKAYRFQIRSNGTGIYDLIEKEIPNTGETTLDVIVNS